MASPTPLFMPRPPVGIMRCTASPARNTRPLRVAIGEQQVLLPFADVEHLVLHRHADGLLELRRHVAVLVDHRVQRPVPGRVLHDEEGRALVGDVVVAAFARAAVDRNSIEQLVAAVERLAQAQDVGFAAQRDAELLAHRAAAAVAAHQVFA